uniref:Uncharacterized protein MANES_07G111100 n=1 Tax=Rhizophora mucronata TaxID=61149 RepID=A0A2P2LHI8_RHIMU
MASLQNSISAYHMLSLHSVPQLGIRRRQGTFLCRSRRSGVSFLVRAEQASEVSASHSQV